MPAPSSSAQAGVDRVSARQSGSRHPRERWDRCLPPLFFARSCTTDAPPPPSASTAYVKKKKQKKRKQCLTECPIRRIITVFFSLSVCLSVCPSICLFLSLYRSILCILFSLSIFLPLSASVCVSLYLSFSFTHILHFYIFLLLLSFSSISRVSLFLSLSIFSSSGKAEKDDVEETVEEEEEEKKKKKKKEKEKTTKKERKKRRRKEEKREDRRPKSEQGRGRRRRLRCPGGELARGWSTTCAIMAEVATKKSISVVSNKKNEVCGVQSNNGLIDLDNITATHNKQLISLCDNNDDEDDLVLTNNTRNELATEDKSLQELIENELALRICSNNGDKKKKKKKKDDDDDDDDDDDGDDDNDGNGDGDGDDEIDEVDDNNDIDNQDEKNRLVKMDEIEEQQTGQPDTVKRILLDRQEDQFRVNTDFIVAELEHCALIGEPYGYQNGHVSPITNVKPEDGANESKKEIVDFDKDKIDDDDDDDDDDDKDAMIMKKTNDEIERERKENEKSEEKEEGSIENENDLFLRSTKTNRSSEEVIANLDDVKFESDDNNVDVESNRSMEINISKVVDNSSPLSCGDKYQQEEEEEEEENKLIESKSFLKDTIELVETDLGKDECLEKKTTWTNEQEEVIMDGQQSGGQFSDNFEDPEQVALTSVINDKLKTIDTKESLIDNTTEYFRNDENVVVGGNTTNNESSAMIMDTIAEVTNKVMESPQDVSSNKSRSFDDVTLSQSETSTDAASTQEFIDMERRVLSEENESNVERNVVDDDDTKKMLEDDLIDRRNDVTLLTSYSNETTREFDYDETANDSRNERFEDNDKCQMSDSTVLLDNTEVVVSAQNLAIFSESKRVESLLIDSVDQSTDQAHKFDSWMTVEEATRIEEDVEIEKERHHEEILTIEREDTNETIITDSDRSTQDDHLAASSPRAPLATPDDETSDIINVCDKSSFNKFDALSKKTVLHVRSVDAGKVQQQLNSVGQNGEANQNCRSCGKVVFQMEQTKAEGLVWHKNCFRCVQCSKQLNVDNYESHESTLYCKPHFKELFQPKPVEESDQSVRPRKPELIIRENEPKELPPDVVRASDKPDLGLEELSSLNVKSRFQVFEKAGTENTTNEIERSPSQIAVKRSPSILSKLAKFQAKGMDIGVADESLNGIPYEESSESEEEEAAEDIEEVETEIVKAKRTTRERPISFSKMDDIKNRWESTSQQGRREVQREARKEEIAGIRSRLFMGKQGKMKEMYQQAVAGSERVTKINAAEEIQHSTHARSIKERFERGEPIAASDDETDSKPKPEKADEEVIAAGISRKSRSLFLELDASAAKTGRPVTPVNPKTPADAPRRARDAFMVRQVSDDVVRSSDTTEEVHVETSDISNKFKFFESYKEPEKQRKQFRITPPRDGQVKQMDSPEREIYRDPDVVRADDRVDEVVHTDTARKMLSIFRQMEENACKEELPEGPKPLKRFTPPPEDKFAKQTASDSEEDEEEEGEESEADESAEERDPNYVRASDKVEDEFLKQAQNAARAKTLRAKFEHWEETDGKPSNHNIAEMEIAQSTGDQSSIESASSLRARFESLGSQTNESPRAPKIKVNRFVEIQASCTDVCESCKKKVYPLEKVETNNKIFHKQCFRCLQCNCVLRMDTFTLNNGKLYCIPHFKQLFITRGNYDEGFGVDPHKNKWATSNANQANVSPIAVSNGDL
uniref:myb-like protein X isoform X18 n=1 Tax=Vespula vulgaris TaxID=7454 RepID=UPI00223B2239|nr:myb-like protein X isoform X18 [Vespula vulgaris]